MTRFIAFLVAAVFMGFATVKADDIGVGKPKSTTTASSQMTASTDDDIGVGETTWYESILGWFVTEDSE